MKKTYVLDTNVILHSPHSILSFEDANVVIPEIVLEELDTFKKNTNELGANARHAARILDSLRKWGKLYQGVQLPNGGVLRVEMNHYDTNIPLSWDRKKADNRIIQVCKALKEEGKDVCLITKDVFERIKADSIDISTDDYNEKVVPEIESQYTGRKEIYISSKCINEFYQKRELNINEIVIYNNLGIINQDIEFYPNEFLLIHSCNSTKHSALGIVSKNKILPLVHKDVNPLGITTRNVGQKFMLQALYSSSKEIPLVIIKGPAGTAKTLFSVAIGLQKILEESNNEFRRILICRPNVTMDEKIGYLPGTEQEKIAPYMRPIIDNLEILIDSDEKERYKNEKELYDKIRELFDRRIITTEAVAFLRGRSIVKNWVIIDEAQNLTPKQVKAITTRIGEGSKLILIGDPEQIDHPFLDCRSNGLCYASERMKGSVLCAQITLKYDECERSPLAHDASKRL